MAADEGSFVETLLDATRPRHDAPFLIEPGGNLLTYGEMFDGAAAMASALAALGVGADDRVLAVVEKSATAVQLYLACLHVGAVIVPVNPRSTQREIDYFIEDAQPRLVVVSEPDPRGPSPAVSRGEIALAALADTKSEVVSFSPPTARSGHELAAILYTSGTTGRPKGAALTHDNLRHNARALHETWRFSGEDHLLHTLPIFHVHGLFVALHCAMLAAIPVTFLSRFDVDSVIAALPGVTVVMGVPTHYGRLLDDPRFDAALTSGIRLFTCGSAPLSDAVFDAFTERTGHHICERYGMTEAGIITSNPYDARLPGTVGFPLPGVVVRVCDDHGAALPPGTHGGIEVRGPHLFQGYWQQPAATASAHRDGWFITGDTGSLDVEGRLTLRGRAGDMIISGGENISPKEIEEVLDAVHGIVESAVIGVPHPDLGEAVTAVLVVDAAYSPEATRAALEDALARFKHPKALIIVKELPRNILGKVTKNELRLRHANHYDDGA